MTSRRWCRARVRKLTQPARSSKTGRSRSLFEYGPSSWAAASSCLLVSGTSCRVPFLAVFRNQPPASLAQIHQAIAAVILGPRRTVMPRLFQPRVSGPGVQLRAFLHPSSGTWCGSAVGGNGSGACWAVIPLQRLTGTPGAAQGAGVRPASSCQRWPKAGLSRPGPVANSMT